MYKNSLIIIISLFFFAFSFSRVHAHGGTHLLVATTFKNDEDLQTLIDNSLHIYEYLPGTESNVFLAIISPLQKENLLEKDFQLQIIEVEPDMSQYRLFYSASANQEDQLTYLGDVYALTKRDILVKLSGTTTFDGTGTAEKFRVSELKEKSITPTIITPSPSEKPVVNNKNTNTIVLLLLGSGVVLLLGAGFFIYLRHTHRQEL